MAGLVALLWAPGGGEEDPARREHRRPSRAGRPQSSTPPPASSTHPVKATSITKSDSKASDDNVVAFDQHQLPGRRQGQPPGLRRRQGPPAGLGEHRRLRHRPDDRTRGQQPPSTCRRTRSRTTAWSTSGPSTPRRRPTPTGTAPSARPSTRSTYGTAKVKGSTPTSTRSTTKDAPIDIAKGVKGTYDDVKRRSTSSRRTGAIVNQTDDQQRYLDRRRPRCSTCSSPSPTPRQDERQRRPATLGQLDLVTKTSRSSASSAALHLHRWPVFLLADGRPSPRSGTRRRPPPPAARRPTAVEPAASPVWRTKIAVPG